MSTTVFAVTPSGIGLENTGFSTGFANLSKYLIGNPVFSKLGITSLPFPTTITLAFSGLKNLLSAFLFAIVFTSTYISLVIENDNLEGLLNFPSNTGLGSLKNQHDITMIFSWARRAVENFSIFELGSNLSGVEKYYHHFSSRGFGLFLSGFSIYLFDDPVNAIFLTYFICSFIIFCYRLYSWFK